MKPLEAKRIRNAAHRRIEECRGALSSCHKWRNPERARERLERELGLLEKIFAKADATWKAWKA